MQPQPIHILTIQFANEISQKNLSAFRGAFIQSIPETPLLLHNHIGDKFRYAYPLVQYKRLNGKAAIVCIGQGVANVNELLEKSVFVLDIKNKGVEMKIESFHLDIVDIGISQNEESYRLANWLPLNSQNYQKYQATENLVDKISMLEKILVGNILSFLKGIGIQLDEQLKLHITDISNLHLMTYKNIKLMAFDIEFKTNIILPQNIGIGKSASLGFGILNNKTIR